MGYKAKACFVGCSDARIQSLTEDWLAEEFDVELVDRVIRPGASAYGMSVVEEVAELHSLHNFPVVVIAHHTDCGKLPQNGRDEHIEHMRSFARHVIEELPEVSVRLVLVHTAEQMVEEIETITVPAS